MVCIDGDHEYCICFMNQHGEAHVIFESEGDMDWFQCESAKAMFRLSKVSMWRLEEGNAVLYDSNCEDELEWQALPVQVRTRMVILSDDYCDGNEPF